MSRLLSELLGASEPMFSASVRQLERGSGDQGVDVRLTAEIIGEAHMRIRELGLDPADTTGRELYHGLTNLVKLHEKFMAERLGIDDPTNVEEVLECLRVTVEKIHIPKTAW